jgi:hypothetical protein
MSYISDLNTYSLKAIVPSLFSPTATITRSTPSFIYSSLRGGFVEPRLKIWPGMFPSHVDGRSHVVSQHDEL